MNYISVPFYQLFLNILTTQSFIKCMNEKLDISLHTLNEVTNVTIFQLTPFQIRNCPYKTGGRTSAAGSYLIGAQTLGDKEVQNIEKAQRVREGMRVVLYLESVFLL